MTDAKSVYGRLREEIVSGALRPGSPLREIALAERFGVSRTPVREALRRLEQDRLLVPGSRGMEVRAIDPHEVVQVSELRILLETEAAGQAAQARATADLLRLEGLLTRDRALADPDDVTRVRTSLEFHAAIWQATHNAVLVDLLERLAHVMHVPHSTLAGDRWREVVDEHAHIVAAIRAGDDRTARELVGAHMNTAREIRLRLLREAASCGRP
jgi:DNA-binding GntR family transcriptional regulator